MRATALGEIPGGVGGGHFMGYFVEIATAETRIKVIYEEMWMRDNIPHNTFLPRNKSVI